MESFIVHDVYYDLIIWVWNAIPAIMIMVGILCLIAAGVSTRNGGMVIE